MVTVAPRRHRPAFDEDKASLLEMAEGGDVPTGQACRTAVCHTHLLDAAAVRRGHLSLLSPSPLTEPDSGELLPCCTGPGTDVNLDL
jgi:hypothetical protein